MTSRVLLFSGGIDSAYLLAKSANCELAELKETLMPVFVGYGQPSQESEWIAAKAIANLVDIQIQKLELSGVNLGDMATGENSRIVPARNLWLIGLAGSFIQNSGCDPFGEVWIGSAPQDHENYPDCREDFLGSLDSATSLLGFRVRWSEANRQERISYLTDRNMIHLTHSCYLESECGECPSCLQ